MPKWLWNSPPHRLVGDLASCGSLQNPEINHHPNEYNLLQLPIPIPTIGY
jgi:hypothetical protein